MEAEHELEIHGTPPQLATLACDELLCEQYWYQGALTAPANVIHFRFASQWSRLTFDHGIIFWRPRSERPEPYTIPDLECETKLDNLGVRLGLAGRILRSYEARAVPDGSEVEFVFEGGIKLVFRNVGDRTTIIF